MTGPDLETSSAAYAARFAGPVGRWLLSTQAEATRALLTGFPPETSVLDVGGGHGQVAPLLLDAGFEVTVLASDPAADDGLRRAGVRGRVRVDVGSFDRLPYASGSVDVVVSYRTLAHVDDWRRFLAELCRVAKASVVVDYASRRSLNAASAALFGWKRHVEGNTRPFRVLSPAEVASAFTASEFDVVRVVPQFAWPMALHRALPLALARGLEAVPRATGLTRLFGSPIVARADRRPV